MSRRFALTPAVEWLETDEGHRRVGHRRNYRNRYDDELFSVVDDTDKGVWSWLVPASPSFWDPSLCETSCRHEHLDAAAALHEAALADTGAESYRQWERKMKGRS
jgi:hypothetical protein